MGNRVATSSLALWLPSLALLGAARAARTFPQYLVLNKANFVADPWAWDQDRPGSASQASIDALLSQLNCTVGPGAGSCRGTDTRRLAFSHIVLLMGVNDTAAMQFLDNTLNLSVANDLPLSVELDVFQWWNARPDLWNWFNASAPGYDPDNIANVEWASWDRVNATMLSWRDWGSQFRTPSPHPNLASPAVLSSYVAALRPFLSRVAAWYAGLPRGQRYLLAGVKLSEEVDIGPNFYFYADGNSYIGRDPADDPKADMNGAVQLGFNAVCTAGIACAGDVTPTQLDTVVQSFYSLLAAAALQSGLPRGKLFAHCGSNFGDMPAGVAWNTGQSAIVPSAAPAYSIYRLAYDPSLAGPLGLDEALDAIGGSQWGIGEWNYMGGNAGTPEEQWAAAFNNSLGYRNVRLLHVFNWEGFYETPGAVAGLLAAMSPASAPVCLVEPPAGLAFTVGGGGESVTVFWTAGPLDATAAYIDASTVPYTLPSAALAVPDVVSHAPVSALPGSGSFTFPLAPGYRNATLYASIVAWGCAAGGRAQAMASEVLALAV